MRARPTAETALALVALFIALSGSAVALKGKNTVDSGDIKNRQVKSQDLAKKVIKPIPEAKGAQSGLELSKDPISASTVAHLLFANDEPTVLDPELAKNGVDTADTEYYFDDLAASKLADGSVKTKKVSPLMPWAELTAPTMTLPAITGAPVDLELTPVHDHTGLEDGNEVCVQGDQAGIYTVQAGVIWESYPHGHRILLILKNESNIVAGEGKRANTSGPTIQSVSAQVQLAPGDCVRAAVQNFGVNYNNISENSEVDLLQFGHFPYFSVTYYAPGESS